MQFIKTFIDHLFIFNVLFPSSHPSGCY